MHKIRFREGKDPLESLPRKNFLATPLVYAIRYDTTEGV